MLAFPVKPAKLNTAASLIKICQPYHWEPVARGEVAGSRSGVSDGGASGIAAAGGGSICGAGAGCASAGEATAATSGDGESRSSCRLTVGLPALATAGARTI